MITATALPAGHLILRILVKRSMPVVNHALIAPANYTIIRQTRDEVIDPDNSPSHSMWPYLVISGQTARLGAISVYAHRGNSRDQARLLYMNAEALTLWQEMEMPCRIVGETHRPPWNAVLSFGKPFRAATLD